MSQELNNPTGANPPAKAGAKVELDLDDAPFLEDDEPEQQPEQEPEAAQEVVEEAPAAPEVAPPNKKKKLIIAGVTGVFLIGVGFMLNMIMFKPKPPVNVPQAPVATGEKTPPAPVEPVQHMMQWEPFWVQLKDTEGAVRFLSCKLTVPTTNANLFAEMNVKKLILRDALFYYLRNQPILSLSDEVRVTAFKGELMTVINEHLASGKINEILIEEYLVQ